MTRRIDPPQVTVRARIPLRLHSRLQAIGQVSQNRLWSPVLFSFERLRWIAACHTTFESDSVWEGVAREGPTRPPAV
jgi:hypothetical protein